MALKAPRSENRQENEGRRDGSRVPACCQPKETPGKKGAVLGPRFCPVGPLGPSLVGEGGSSAGESGASLRCRRKTHRAP